MRIHLLIFICILFNLFFLKTNAQQTDLQGLTVIPNGKSAISISWEANKFHTFDINLTALKGGTQTQQATIHSAENIARLKTDYGILSIPLQKI